MLFFGKKIEDMAGRCREADTLARAEQLARRNPLHRHAEFLEIDLKLVERRVIEDTKREMVDPGGIGLAQHQTEQVALVPGLEIDPAFSVATGLDQAKNGAVMMDRLVHVQHPDLGVAGPGNAGKSHDVSPCDLNRILYLFWKSAVDLADDPDFQGRFGANAAGQNPIRRLVFNRDMGSAHLGALIVTSDDFNLADPAATTATAQWNSLATKLRHAMKYRHRLGAWKFDIGVDNRYPMPLRHCHATSLRSWSRGCWAFRPSSVHPSSDIILVGPN